MSGSEWKIADRSGIFMQASVAEWCSHGMLLLGEHAGDNGAVST
jgi:hypothetical protein